MEDETLTALSQREAAFWIALGLVIVGSVMNSGQLDDTLVMIGMAILVVRVLVALHRIFRASAIAGKDGYLHGKQAD